MTPTRNCLLTERVMTATTTNNINNNNPDKFKDQQHSEHDDNDVDMLDQALERTPAFKKETAEELESKLLKKIKIADCDKYRSLDQKSDLKKSRLELLENSKKKSD